MYKRQEKKTAYDDTRKVIRFQKLSREEQAALVQREPQYGRVICRCETVTEGEIVAALHSPLPPCSCLLYTSDEGTTCRIHLPVTTVDSESPEGGKSQ